MQLKNPHTSHLASELIADKFAGLDRHSGSLLVCCIFFIVRLDVVDDIADLARLERAAQTAKHLVGAARALVDDKLLAETKVAGFGSVAVPDFALLDGLVVKLAVGGRGPHGSMPLDYHRWV